MLIDKIVIYELAEGLNIEIEVNANFKNHRNYYDENGRLIDNSDDLDRVYARNNFIRRSRGRKSGVDARP
ncbi:MAG: hypothetical protein J1E85_10050 [Ruminococcus sp.]|nr:hypothetical protein [Ruminococcus sp.]